MNRVGIIIVNYNGASYQNECLRSLYNMDYLDFDVIVVDSASTDNSIELLLKEFPKTVVLKQEDNVGVAKGNNIGIKYALQNGNEYILLMNNDVIIDKAMLGEMVKRIDAKTIVVPKIYYYKPSDLLWFAGGQMNWKLIIGEHFGENKVDDGSYDEEMNITYAPTCCMLFHKSVFDQIGYEDEKYFMYYDDTDLCVRIIDKGYVIKYVPSAFMWHKISSSIGGSKSKLATYYHNRNKLYFISKFKDKISLKNRIGAYLYGIGKMIVGLVYKRYNLEIFYAFKDYMQGKMYRR